MPLTAAYSTFARSAPAFMFVSMKRKMLLELRATGATASRRRRSRTPRACRSPRSRCWLRATSGSTSTSGMLYWTLVERGVQHLLRVDARRIDVAILDAHEHEVEDLQCRQVVPQIARLARVRLGPLACRDPTETTPSGDWRITVSTSARAPGHHHGGQVQPAAHRPIIGCTSSAPAPASVERAIVWWAHVVWS